MNRVLIVFIIAGLYFSEVAGSIPVGAWRDHFSYSRAEHVSVSGNKVFCASGPGIIIYNKDDNSLEKLSKVNGLSDVDISSIKWSEANQLLIVGYSNGNLDIIDGSRIINLSDILRSAVPGSKNINSIMVAGNRAYLSCSFGIVVINLDRKEISDTYFLGDDGIRLAVNDMAFDGTYLYAATSSGLYKADLNAPNLLDFAFWERLEFLPEAGALFSSVAWFGEKLVAAQLDGSGRYNAYIIDGDSWDHFSGPYDSPVRFKVSGNFISLIRQSETEIFDSGIALVNRINDYGIWGIATRDVSVNEDGSVWIADRIHGLVRGSGGKYNVLTPSGPWSNRVFSITSYAKRTYFAAGGFNSAFNNLWQNGEFSVFREEVWSSRINYDIRDVIQITEHPGNPETLFLATWGYGLVEYREGRFHEKYTEVNSSLRSIIAGGDFIRIGGMAFDEDKNLWVTNSGVPNPVSVMKENGEWVSLPYGAAINHDYTGDLIISQTGHKWILLPRGGGLFVFDDNKTPDDASDDLTRKFSITDENNTLISNEVFSIAEDKNGIIWVGTNNGVAVYYNPSRVFTDDSFLARRIVVSGSRDEDLGYLLNNETVTVITVDGADRKWFGTEKSGAFLVSADGKNQIHHFTRQNSPLPDNNITDIAIDPVTGEIFFGTSAGVVSFRGEATEPGEVFSNVYAFPNPVRENYHGPVTVTGLVKGSILKITDITGNLVYETTSLGGQAVWDGLNSSGRRVQTGIYLIFISDADGTQTHVAKLMFIH